MKNKWLLVMIILTIINISAFGTFAYKRWCHRRGKNGEEPLRYLKRELALTEEQVAKVKESGQRFLPKIEGMSQTVREKRQELIAELMKESPDEASIERSLQQIALAQADLQREVVKNLRVQKGIFTAAQQEKFFSLVLERFSVRDTPHVKE